ncbi:unnamed protein product [Prorocentrum cordatum]|uniref:PDZ domain-containing protein n=1 Tax=Prorocentrum cordatum TaxID=2364126 RepID=A0ABN9XAW0_9DINO|nr:unnamed protein product [Polarella glacialis]
MERSLLVSFTAGSNRSGLARGCFDSSCQACAGGGIVQDEQKRALWQGMSAWLKQKAAQAQEAARAAALRAQEEAARLGGEAQDAAKRQAEELKRNAAELQKNASGLAAGMQGLFAEDSAAAPRRRDVSLQDGPLGFDIEGARVVHVDPDGQAASLGIRVGDQILAVEGDQIPAPPPTDTAAEGEVKVKKLIRKRIKDGTGHAQ